MQHATATFRCVRKSESGQFDRSQQRAEWMDCVPKFVINLAPKCIKSLVFGGLCYSGHKASDFQLNDTDNN